eukprot:s4787_g4.t1
MPGPLDDVHCSVRRRLAALQPPAAEADVPSTGAATSLQEQKTEERFWREIVPAADADADELQRCFCRAGRLLLHLSFVNLLDLICWGTLRRKEQAGGRTLAGTDRSSDSSAILRRVRSNAETEGGEEEAETGDDPFGSFAEGADRPSDFGLPSHISDISGFSSLSSRAGLGFGPQTRD